MGIVGGGEASAAAQPATGGRSMRHDRRCFGRLEQEDQRLKKHDGRWMDIIRSLQLESFILTKLTKPLVRVNLVGPQLGFARENIAHLRFVRMYNPFFNSNGIKIQDDVKKVSMMKSEVTNNHKLGPPYAIYPLYIL